MMRNWDERTRAWVRNSVARHLPLAAGEEIVARMAGGHLDTTDPFEQAVERQHNHDRPQPLSQGGNEHADEDGEDAGRGIWRPGTIYLTTHRLIAYRRDPHEILWQAPLSDIDRADVEVQRSIGGEDRSRLRIRTTGGTDTLLSAAEPERLRNLLQRQGLSGGETAASGLATGGVAMIDGGSAGTAGDQNGSGTTSGSRPAQLAQARMWLREQRSKDPVWRGGTGTFDLDRGLTWKGPLDSRPALRLHATEIDSMELARGHSPLRGSPILVVHSGPTEVHLATDHPDRWMRLIQHVQQVEEVRR